MEKRHDDYAVVTHPVQQVIAIDEQFSKCEVADTRSNDTLTDRAPAGISSRSMSTSSMPAMRFGMVTQERCSTSSTLAPPADECVALA
jgi:hypothetical protein